jgi:hypothetical protein
MIKAIRVKQTVNIFNENESFYVNKLLPFKYENNSVLEISLC